MLKQIMFRDEDGTVLGGFLTDSGEIICGCCGGIFGDAKIVKVFEDWVDLSEEILGGEFPDEEEEE